MFDTARASGVLVCSGHIVGPGSRWRAEGAPTTTTVLRIDGARCSWWRVTHNRCRSLLFEGVRSGTTETERSRAFPLLAGRTCGTHLGVRGLTVPARAGVVLSCECTVVRRPEFEGRGAAPAISQFGAHAAGLGL